MQPGRLQFLFAIVLLTSMNVAVARSTVERVLCAGTSSGGLADEVAAMLATARANRYPIAAVFVTAQVGEESFHATRRGAVVTGEVLRLLYVGGLDPGLKANANVLAVVTTACDKESTAVEVSILLDDSAATRQPSQ